MTEFNPDDIMLQNYIQNKLSPKDTEQLELWLADHPDVMHDLELDLMFSQSKYDLNETKQPKQTQSFSLWDFFASKKLVPINVLAYGLALLFVFNTFLNNDTNNNNYSSATFIELEKQRGAEPDIIEVQANNNKSMVLRFFPDSLTEKYSLVLQSKFSDQKLEFENLVADEFGSITISHNLNKNKKNHWEVSVVKNTNVLEQQYIIILK